MQKDWSAKWVSVSKDISEAARTQPVPPKNWSSTIQCKKCVKQREGREVWCLSARFVSTSTKQQKKAHTLKYNRNTHTGRKPQVEEQLSKTAVLHGRGLEHIASRVLRNRANILSELGRIYESLVRLLKRKEERAQGFTHHSETILNTTKFPFFRQDEPRTWHWLHFSRTDHTDSTSVKSKSLL